MCFGSPHTTDQPIPCNTCSEQSSFVASKASMASGWSSLICVTHKAMWEGRFRIYSSPFIVEGNSALAKDWTPREGIWKKDAGKWRPLPLWDIPKSEFRVDISFLHCGAQGIQRVPWATVLFLLMNTCYLSIDFKTLPHTIENARVLGCGKEAALPINPLPLQTFWPPLGGDSMVFNPS